MVEVKTRPTAPHFEIGSPMYSYMERLNGTGFSITVQDNLNDPDLSKARRTEFNIRANKSFFSRTDLTGHAIDDLPTVDDVAAMFAHANANPIKTQAFDVLKKETADFLVQRKIYAENQEYFDHVEDLEIELFGRSNISTPLKKSA